jgi:hypothetical protein
MTNCLLHHGITAVTGRLDVRFRAPVRLGEPVEILAYIASRYKVLYRMEAELRQDGRVAAWTKAKFAETQSHQRVKSPTGEEGGALGPASQ